MPHISGLFYRLTLWWEIHIATSGCILSKAMKKQQQLIHISQSYGSQNNHNVPTEVTAVSLSSTEKEIYSGTNRGIINVWDMETAKCKVQMIQLLYL